MQICLFSHRRRYTLTASGTTLASWAKKERLATEWSTWPGRRIWTVRPPPLSSTCHTSVLQVCERFVDKDRVDPGGVRGWALNERSQGTKVFTGRWAEEKDVWGQKLALLPGLLLYWSLGRRGVRFGFTTTWQSIIDPLWGRLPYRRKERLRMLTSAWQK